jgi:hypothetical protein
VRIGDPTVVQGEETVERREEEECEVLEDEKENGEPIGYVGSLDPLSIGHGWVKESRCGTWLNRCRAGQKPGSGVRSLDLKRVVEAMII